jgi:hypothetical protein
MQGDEEFKFDGIQYVAVDTDMDLVDMCAGCHLKAKWPCISCKVLCAPPDRADGRDVIYIEVGK